ncbi:hypothetical protein PRIPAC_82493 [Pristionchus pacificus]|uniref:G protein-coupled receptor n=1 Tax=Pristionchus pacificus TaxID=54126 RepID=A0A2A6C1K4_PRIPA|nr:hypothetical protein PRIPAC_82493 [Pristionchus pacificus]|eukprot:PDM72132.1 G protein-coupled receptor [Pristionchus pacificus]
MNISEARKQLLNRPSYHGTLGILTFLMVPLYIFEMIVLMKRRRKPPFDSFFFFLWKFQAILDLGALINYFLVIEQMIPSLLIGLVYLGVPLLLCIPLIVATPTYYYYSSYNTVVQLETTAHAGIQAAITGPLAIVCTLTSTVCYVAIFIKIVVIKMKMSGHIGKRDLRATRLAFLLFVSLIVNFVYLVVYMIGGYFNNAQILIFISSYNFVPNFMLALINPWSLLLHRSFRRQLLLMSSKSSIVAGRAFTNSDPITRRTESAIRATESTIRATSTT